MLYLLPVNHAVQSGKNTKETTNYLAKLSDLVSSLNIETVAEEWSQDASEIWKIDTSTTTVFAKEKNINYLQCDPDTKMREMLGISQRQLQSKFGFKSTHEGTAERKAREAYERPIREGYWFNQIKLVTHGIIFIFGTSHIVSLKELLERHNFPAQALPKDTFSAECLLTF